MSLFSEKFKEAVEACGVPVGELAERSGVSASMLYKMQSGSRLPDSVGTLEKLVDAMVCALPLRLELLHDYRVAKIGAVRYAGFEELKEMLTELTVPLGPVQTRQPVDEALPTSVYGGGNVNHLVRATLERETMIPGGRIAMQLPLRYEYGMECLSQVLRSCHPQFQAIRHLFCLKATATGDALLYNMRAIRQVLPRMLTLEHYEPCYCYLPDPDDGTAPFPYFILSRQEVLLIAGDLQSAVRIADRDVAEQFQRRYRELGRRYSPVMRGGGGDVMSYIQVHQALVGTLEKPPQPLTLAAEPCILPCLRPEAAPKYLPPGSMDDPAVAAFVEQFFKVGRQYGYTTFFTMDGVRALVETGVIMEMRGPAIPRFEREDILDALEELIRRGKEGAVTLHVFRQEIFRGGIRLSMGLYENKLFTGCEAASGGNVFSDITEATLCRVLRDYTDCALMLGDVFSHEISLKLLEEAVAHLQSLP